ncbi:hypothetical protein N7513_008706 [Penicillium frequentans]|nr:hypothetical protein N7513_008706 [Penicillium glabrum]
MSAMLHLQYIKVMYPFLLADPEIPIVQNIRGGVKASEGNTVIYRSSRTIDLRKKTLKFASTFYKVF